MFTRKSFLKSLFLCLILVSSSSRTGLATEGSLWKATFAEAEAESRRLNLPMLIHFHTSWCGPCRKMEATVLNTPEVAACLKDRLIGVKVDADKHPDLAKRFDVKLYPSDRIVSPDGKVVFSSEGYTARSNYVATLERNSRIPVKAPPAIVVDAPKEQLAQKRPVDNSPRAMVLAMEGYCPVTLWRTRVWVKGDQKFALQYMGVVYYFKGAEERDEFQKQATLYSPKFAGCDPVSFWETQKAVQGSPQYAAFYDGKLYLFENPESRAKFRENPDRYIQQRKVVQAERIESKTWH